jgi:hypothetical protein
VIGVAVKIRAAIKLFSNDAQFVYFARLDAEGNAEGEPIMSNYSSGKYVYLVNARPGRYAVVAAGYVKETQGAPMGAGANVGGGFSVSVSVTTTLNNTFTSYLPKPLIEKTTVTVGEAQLEFLGELVIDTSGDWGAADAEQLRYYREFAPGHEDMNFLVKAFSRQSHTRGIEHEIDQTDDARSRFVAHSHKELAGWEGVLRSPVASEPPVD